MEQITSRTDWTPELITQVYDEIEKIAYEELELEGQVYPNQLEIISAEQMIDAYSSVGLPINYTHWSFGKDFLKTKTAYDKGHQHLAYEIVINSRPCISYLMEENDMMMQALVIAHAAFGHNFVFKNNVAFKQWTDAGSIVDYMAFAKDYIVRCEDRYGVEAVERVLDAAHALAPHGIDKYPRKHSSIVSEEARLRLLIEEDDERQKNLDIIMDRTRIHREEAKISEEEIEADQEENLLYFIMKKSPSLEDWKREILRIVWKVNQYFSPQGGTKVLNEGFASFTHYYIMTRLEEKGILSPDAYMSFLTSHAGVLFQPGYDSRYYSGFNPYALGFAILMDVKRICENPTEEDKQWMPHLIGRRWQDAVKEAVSEYRDDGFIMQFLSPKVIRDLRLFAVAIRENAVHDRSAIVAEIHDDIGYREVRRILAQSHERQNFVPQIVVTRADLKEDRTLYLKYIPFRGRQLHRKSAMTVVDYIDELWGYPVVLDDGRPD